jgi:proteasome lid subunit RPN8/RPN11
MKTMLRLQAGVFEDLMAHLLPKRGRREEGAFLFASIAHREDLVLIEVTEVRKLQAQDFAEQCKDYLELADETRVSLIQRAHQLGAALVEMHSHPGPWPAEFSEADWAGFSESVPHFLWRLPERPYAAIVVARSGFDALVWHERGAAASRLEALVAGDQIWRPTNLSELRQPT